MVREAPSLPQPRAERQPPGGVTPPGGTNASRERRPRYSAVFFACSPLAEYVAKSNFGLISGVWQERQ